MTKEFTYPPIIRKMTVGGMFYGAVLFLSFALIAIFLKGPLFLVFMSLGVSTFFLIIYIKFRISMSRIQIDEKGIWYLFRGKKKNHCEWSDVTRAVNRPDWSLALQGDIELWMLFAISRGKKTKLVFDNNIEGYAELACLVTEQVERRGIKVDRK